MDKIQCPTCGSSSVKTREMIYKTGSSLFYSRRFSRGISFNLRGRSRPKLWFGRSYSRGKRQSFLAREVEPAPYWPVFASGLFSYGLFQSHSLEWSFLWGSFSIFWFFHARSDHLNAKKEWICMRCGTKFICKYVDEKDEEHQENEVYKIEDNHKDSKEVKKITSKKQQSAKKKDYTKYIFSGKKLGKGRLVLSVIKRYISENQEITYKQLKEIFPDSLQSSSKIQFSSVRVVFDKEDNIIDQDKKRFFMKDEEIISIKDCKIAVSKEWNYQNIKNILNVAAKLGYHIEIAE